MRPSAERKVWQHGAFTKALLDAFNDLSPRCKRRIWRTEAVPFDLHHAIWC